MSETPSKKVSTGKSVANSKRVTATTGDKAPAKKAAPKKAAPKVTKAEAVNAVDKAVKVVEDNKGTVKRVAKKIDPALTDAQLEVVLNEVPGFWAKIKSFLLGK